MNSEIMAKSFVLQKIEDRINHTLKNMDIGNPNVAKVAGIVMFWVRNLKPFSYAPDAAAKSSKLRPLNEHIGMQAGLAICRTYKDYHSLDNWQAV